MEFQVTKKNKWRIYYLRLCFSIAIGLSLTFTMIYYYPQWWLGIIIYMMIIIFAIDRGPALYLFKEQLRFNNGCILSIKNKNLSFTDVNDYNIQGDFSDIKQIIVYMPPNNYRNTITMLAMEDFSYARFELKNGQEFYVTSLMIPKLKNFVTEYLSGVPVDYHRWWIFPSIRLCNYFRRKKGLLPTKTSEYSKEKPESKPGNELSSVES